MTGEVTIIQGDHELPIGSVVEREVMWVDRVWHKIYLRVIREATWAELVAQAHKHGETADCLGGPKPYIYAVQVG